MPAFRGYEVACTDKRLTENMQNMVDPLKIIKEKMEGPNSAHSYLLKYLYYYSPISDVLFAANDFSSLKNMIADFDLLTHLAGRIYLALQHKSDDLFDVC